MRSQRQSQADYEASCETVSRILIDLERGAGVTITPLRVRGLAAVSGRVILAIGGLRHVLDVADTRLLAAAIRDEEVRDDSAVLAIKLETAAIFAEINEPAADDDADGWRGACPFPIHVSPVLVPPPTSL